MSSSEDGKNMLNLKTYTCECGMEIEVACLSELEDKIKKHKCRKVNKKVARTKELQQQQIDHFVQDTVVNGIEQNIFNKLVRQGVICRD